MKHPVRRTFVVALSIAALGAGTAGADTIRVQSTTDTVDAGLKDDVIVPGYKAAQPGDTLEYTGVGTGKALDNARKGLADVVVTHAPSLEKQFADDGYSLEGAGRAIFYSDYVIVGPKSDPAGVKADAPHDAVKAFEDIAAANAGGGPKASFISRGDASGTNVQEQLMWHLTGANVDKKTASNAGTATDRDEPWDSKASAYPSWYRKTSLGQADNLKKADACAAADAPDGNCYTIVDRGTFNRQQASGTVTNLAIVSENNDASARGGKDLLINPFSVYIVNPDKITTSPKPNVVAARRFVDYLTSPEFQAKVDTYPSTTNPAFRGDAFPAIAVGTPPPPAAAAGSSFPIALTLTNKQPGAPSVNGQPVQLQASTDNGASWSDVGTPGATDSSGRVSFAPTIGGSTTSYRVSLGRFQSTYWNAFSPTQQTLGTVVSVPTKAIPKPAPQGSSTPKDKVKPKVSRAKLTRRRLTLRISEAGRVRVTLARRVVKHVRENGKRRTVVSYRTAKTVTAKAKKAGTLKLTWKHAIRAGRYRATVRSTDTAGNSRTQKLKLTLKGS